MSEANDHRGQARSRILQAAADLLHESGPAALTTRGVAHAAGVQAPTIYRLFGDKDGLLDAVAEFVMATHATAKATVVADATSRDLDPLADLRAGWDAQIAFGVANPTIFRLLSDPDRVRSSPAARTGREVLRARLHRVARTGRLRVSEARAVDTFQAAGIGTIQTLLALPVDERDPGLADGMYEAVLRQVLTDPDPDRETGGAAGGPTAAAVAFRTLVPQLTALGEAERALLTHWLDRVIDAG